MTNEGKMPDQGQSSTATSGGSGARRARLTSRGAVLIPSEPPDGYVPPTTSDELVARYSEGERYFGGTVLRDGVLAMENLADAVLRDSDLEGCQFTLSHMYSVDLRGANLRGALFNQTNLIHSKLDGADLTGANLFNPNLRGCSVENAVLRNATVMGVDFGDVDLAGFLVGDLRSRAPSSIGQDTLWKTMKSLEGRPDRLEHVEALLRACMIDEEEWPWRRSEGLNIYLARAAGLVDRILVEGLVYGVLGPDTDCRLVEYRETPHGAVLRLKGRSLADLEAIAEALDQRVWTMKSSAEDEVIARMGQVLRRDEVVGLLERLHRDVERLELRWFDANTLEMLQDQGRAHVRKKDLQLIRTWPQKAARVLGRAVAKKLGAKGVGELVDGVLELPVSDDDA